MTRIFARLLPALLLLSGCSLLGKKKTTDPKGDDQATEARSQGKWKALPSVLDFYDEVKRVTARFKLEIFSNGELASEAGGEYEYFKGESLWRYMAADGKLQRVVECFIDKAVVKVPQKRRRKTSLKVVATHEAKYPCVLQALVHYSGAVKRNRLDHDGKIFVVNKYDADRKLVTKVTMVKGTTTMVYSFSQIVFKPMPGQVLPNTKPAVKAPSLEKKKSVAPPKAGTPAPSPEKKNPPKPKGKEPVDEETPPL